MVWKCRNMRLPGIKRITTLNIQSHETVVIDLPPTGLVQFRGDNSDGKSVIPKMLSDAVFCKLHILANRDPLINYDQSWGKMIIERYDGLVWVINIDKEASKTYYELQYPNGEKVRRYLADKNLISMVREFGFHVIDEKEFSLNIYNTYDPLIFLNTPGRLNLEAVDTATTDHYAESAVRGIDEAIKETETSYKRISDNITLSEHKLASLNMWDIDKQEEKKRNLEYLMLNIRALETPDLPDFPRMIDISNIERLYTGGVARALVQLKVVRNEGFEILEQLEPLAAVLPDIKAVASRDLSTEIHTMLEFEAAFLEQKCPMCERGYSLDDESVSATLQSIQ